VNSELFLRLFSAVRGALYSLGFILLWYWLGISARRFDPQIPFQIPAGLQPLGLAVGGCGALLAFSCVYVFAIRGRGTPAPFDPPRIFVPTGPYRFVRNPMYIGGAAVIAGAGLLLQSSAILLLAGGFLLFFHAFVLLYEEPALRARFGESYVQYTKSVRRWLPRFRN
jgi:protein-S-isoprenylcysteine O-methyltransferase Ste14